MISRYVKVLREYALSKQPNLGDGETVLALLYDAYDERNGVESQQIRDDFIAIYQAMHDRTMEEKDCVIHAVCNLCIDYERTAFAEGVKVGLRLSEELVS